MNTSSSSGISRKAIAPSRFLTNFSMRCGQRSARVVVLLVLACSTVHGQVATGSGPSDPAPRSGIDGWRAPAPQDQEGGRDTDAQPASILGTVTDELSAPIAGASVVLQGPVDSDRRTVATDNNGVFEIHNVRPGTSYRLTISSDGFVDWASPVTILDPGERRVLTVTRLQIIKVDVEVTVRAKTNEEIATEQVKVALQQRGFGVLPNFFEVFPSRDGSPPAPLTVKLKYSLAFKAATDPVTVAGVVFLTGVGQAGGFLRYGAGVEGFSQRFAANYVNSLTDIMIGGAVLPSLLHQDPRYFYQGTGTTKSRAVHAVSSWFIAKGDNGRLQPNYSMLGGDLASAALSSLYYPAPNRGAGQVWQNFAIEGAIHFSVGLLQEFVFRPAK